LISYFTLSLFLFLHGIGKGEVDFYASFSKNGSPTRGRRGTRKNRPKLVGWHKQNNKAGISRKQPCTYLNEVCMYLREAHMYLRTANTYPREVCTDLKGTYTEPRKAYTDPKKVYTGRRRLHTNLRRVCMKVFTPSE
jgi:hypothetical protein